MRLGSERGRDVDDCLPADRQSPFWAASSLIEGGLKKIDVEDMEKVLAAKVFGARFSVTDDAFVLYNLGGIAFSTPSDASITERFRVRLAVKA